MRITIAVTAKNEEGAIETCLRSLIASIKYAESEDSTRFDLVVVLDDCTDDTERIVKTFPRAATLLSAGGLVEAQRAVGKRAPFVIFCDADIIIDTRTILEITRVMISHPELQVAYPLKEPRKPRRKSPLALSLYSYNANSGFETRRTYFNGKLFAIRNWNIPSKEEIVHRIRKVRPNRFYHYEAGLRADDIYLSKAILHKHGPGAIREVPESRIYYQAPETFEGMHRYYRRMRMELERISVLFPEFEGTSSENPKRRTDWTLLRSAKLSQQLGWLLFQLAFRLCRLRYRLERFYYTQLSKKTCPFWPPVTETKTFSSDGGNPTESLPSKSGT